MGDFNAGPGDEIMKDITRGGLLVNAAGLLLQGRWELTGTRDNGR